MGQVPDGTRIQGRVRLLVGCHEVSLGPVPGDGWSL